MQSIFLCISVGTALLLTVSYSRTEPNDRSILDVLTSLILSATILCLAQQCSPSLFSIRDRRGRYDAIPLDEYPQRDYPLQQEKPALGTGKLGGRSQTILISTAIVAFTIRIELYRKIAESAQCASRSWEVFMPLILAINECRYQQPDQTEDNARRSLHDGESSTLKSYMLRRTWRFVPSALVLTCGCYSMTALWSAQSSTFICPIVSGEITSIPRLQQFAVTLDCLIAIIAQEIARLNSASRSRKLSVPVSYACVLFGTALCWSVYALALYFAKWEEMQWLLVNDSPSSYRPVQLAVGRDIAVVAFVLSSTYCILNMGIYHMSMILMASVTLVLGLSNIWSAKTPFPPNASAVSIWPFLAIYVGFWSSYRIAQATVQIPICRTGIWQILSYIVLMILVVPNLRYDGEVSFHPIESLMFSAKSQHESYIKYASQSTDLRSACSTYRERYHGNPPPSFDIWYEYARNRSVLVMDDYDQIHRDLLPFRSLKPADIRRQTWEIVSNPWNEVSGISIRNGTAEVQENVLPTHRWMLEGVAVLINAFAKHLPDMDVAFNLNDESRVALPYTKIESLRAHAIQNIFNGRTGWSTDRASTWSPTATEELQTTIFENFSFQKNFHRFGTIGCPPDSLSAILPHLSSQSLLCLSCLKPHSEGQFLSNWTLAADMCHQPDMSHLHGFYLSPAAFKTTHELVPVFSQSKASGYNDIVYPSAWNYMDKVMYEPSIANGTPGSDGYSPGYPDPPFAKKETVLYWRGATSEGVSAGLHSWRGMTRQRLVHLANNATSDYDHDRTTILLPDQRRPEEYKYYSLPGSALSSLGLQQMTDIKIADHIARCGGVDCTDQEKEFSLVTPVNFQAHWQYKFLFDMDGAGFSGRFLPFLQSRSLPFKTALFREWYDSRITAWRHFVPIDLRLHGVWSTLAYFAGVDGTWPGSGGKKFKWEAHTSQAETIAEEGRKWAGRVLRKEDMEVYFFRLLLEWGRLTDDNRDMLGFMVD